MYCYTTFCKKYGSYVHVLSILFLCISLWIMSGIFSAVTHGLSPGSPKGHSLGNITSTMKRVQMLTFPSVLLIMYFARSKSCSTVELLRWTNGSDLHQYKQAPVVAVEYLNYCANWCMATQHCVMLTWSPGTCWQVVPIEIGEPVLGTVYVPLMARRITGEVDIAKVCHGPLARYVKLRVRMRRECRERFPRRSG